jgi:diketogulonate reductase-like aldo/keto reductase
MHCAAEEAALPERVKLAGPAGDWRDSWRALEAMYREGRIRALGVSNFGRDELRELLGMASVRPRVLQHNVRLIEPRQRGAQRGS